MNINSLQITQINSPFQLKEFLNLRENEAKNLMGDIAAASEVLNEIVKIENNPNDLKGYVNLIGRKFKIIDDPVAESIEMAKELNPQISSLAKSHVLFVMSFVVSPNKFIQMLPFDAKMVIIRYLDRIYVQEANKFSEKIDDINKKLGTG